jgi:hypothetical protein
MRKSVVRPRTCNPPAIRYRSNRQEERPGEGYMEKDFDYEATIASVMAVAMAGICWAVLIAPLAG